MTRRLAIAGWTSAACLLLFVGARIVTREAAPRIEITWNVDGLERQQLERRFQLLDADNQSGRVWSYDLIDTSTANVRAIVSNPAVSSTVGLDRERLQPDSTAPRGTRSIWLADRLPVLKQPFVVPAILLVCLATLAGSLLLWCWPMRRRWSSGRTLVAFFGSRIPRINAAELGFYRVVFGLLLFWTLQAIQLPLDPFPREFHHRSVWLADWDWIHTIAEQPRYIVQLEQLIGITLALFTVGFLTRPVYWLLAAELVIWTLVRLQRTGTHPWAVALITVLCLLPVRWGDGFSLDEMLRRWRGRGLEPRLAGRAYGFALWIPGLVFGSAMAAAGVAKLRGGGIDWIAAGTVKYYFVIDSTNAPVDWGLWIATHHGVAVLISFLAVATELSMGAGPFIRSYLARLPLALAGLGLLLGFYLFQNELWLAWWMLWALFYVPWAGLFRVIRRAIPAQTVFIDGECARCRLVARVLGGFDWFNRLSFLPAENEAWLDSMRVRNTKGDIATGYRAYLRIGAAIPFFWPLLPAGLILLIGNAGERIYQRVARARVRKPIDVCTIQRATRPSVCLTRGHVAVALLVLTIQGVASVKGVEIEPLMSSYPMYSGSYASIDDFERRQAMPSVYSFSMTAGGREYDITSTLDNLELDEIFRNDLSSLADGRPFTAEMRTRLATGISHLESATGVKAETVSIKIDQRAFDWSRGVFYWRFRGQTRGTLLVRTQEFVKPSS